MSELYGEQSYYKSTAKFGGEFSNTQTENTPDAGYEFYKIYCVTETVIASYTGNISGLAAVTLPIRTVIKGRFSSVTLTSGSVILYQDKDRVFS